MTDPTPPNPLVVDVDEIARRLNLDTPVESGTGETIRQAILNAQADVESYLGRLIVPGIRQARGVHPLPWATDWAKQIDDDVIEVISVTPEVFIDTGRTSGTFTVSYWSGLDVRNDPNLRPILRYVAAAAMNEPAVLDVWSATVRPRGSLTSVSVDGQTASFAAPWHGQGTIPGSGAPGALPTLASLYPWKRQAVFQRRDADLFQRDWWV